MKKNSKHTTECIVKETSVRDSSFSDFLSLAENIYNDDPHWIAPIDTEIRRLLDPDKNPYFRNASLKIFVCYLNHKPAARSILVINRSHHERWKDRCAFFGFFEAINDPEPVKKLFSLIEEEAIKAGADSLIGPFNPNHYSELGILANNYGTDPLFFETYNKAWYRELLENAGFSTCESFRTMINTSNREARLKKPDVPPVDIKSSAIRIRKFNIFRYRRDMEIIREVNNDAFSDNWHFLPLSAEEYSYTGRFLFFITRPGMIQICEYKGQPVGVTQFVLNVNSVLKKYRGKIRWFDYPLILLQRSRIKEIIVYTFGVKKRFHNTRVASAMLQEVQKILRKYPVAATTWISDKNRSAKRSAEVFDLKPYKQFLMFKKEI